MNKCWLRKTVLILDSAAALAQTRRAVMAKLIPFHIPANFHAPKTRWTPPELRGKVIMFTPAPDRKSA